MEQSLNSYYVFYQVAISGNITIAAKKLYISQPAISKAIQKLEEELQTSLFLRNSRGVSLTEDGKILFKQVETAFLAIENGEKQLRAKKETHSWSLSIGVSSTLCKYVLLPYLKNYMERYPNVTINIKCQSTFETIEDLKKGNLDLGLIGESSQKEALAFRPFLQIQDCFVYSKGYLKRSGRNLTTEKEFFSQEKIMMLDKNNITRKYVDQYFRKKQLECNNLLEVSSMDLLIEFAKMDLGAACVIRQFVEKELENGELIEYRLHSALPSRKVVFAYKKAAEKTAAIDSFLNDIYETN